MIKCFLENKNKVKLYQVLKVISHFCVSSCRFRESNFPVSFSWTLLSVQRRSTTFTLVTHSMANIKTYKRHFSHFCASSDLIAANILAYRLVYLQKLRLGQGVEFSQWWHSMAGINICKRHSSHSFVSSNCFRDIKISNGWYWKSRQWSRSTALAVMWFDSLYRNQGVQIFQRRHLMTNNKINKWRFFRILRYDSQFLRY